MCSHSSTSIKNLRFRTVTSSLLPLSVCHKRALFVCQCSEHRVFVWSRVLCSLNSYTACSGALYSTVCTYICTALIGTLLLPRCAHTQHLVDIMDLLIFSHWRSAIQFKVIQPTDLDPNQQYLLAGFPHGVRSTFLYCTSFLLNFWRMPRRSACMLHADDACAQSSILLAPAVA